MKYWELLEQIAERDKKIIEDFDAGYRPRVICEKHNISKARLYQIVARERAENGTKKNNYLGGSHE